LNKQELATKIWTTADELRKNIKASEYKDYILGFMFYKYLSDKELDFVKAEGGSIDDLKDSSEDNKRYFQDNLGFFISFDDLFSTWQATGGKLGAQNVASAIENFYQNLNEKYARCFYVYNKEVNRHSGVFDALDSGLSKLGENAGNRDKAVRSIVELVAQIPPKSKQYDVLGYIYEYLIKQFSSEAKKDGAFYTPHEMTSLMARIMAERLKDRKEITVYDPCVGTAGLLLNIGHEAAKYIEPNNIKYYGQELITETSNIAKMNLFMQDIPVQNIVVRNADTLEDDWPYFDENTAYTPLFVDAVTANPPYSLNWNPDLYKMDERFRQYGLAPASRADLAFLLHCLYHVKPDGIVSIVLPHGILFREGSEGEIRKNLIDNNNIETIIGMPGNLFFATGIPVCIVILSKNRHASDVLFVDASECFKKDKNQNVLRECDVQRIFDAVQERKDIPHFAKLVSKERIIQEEYNLNIPRYISSETEDEQYDLYSLMTGLISDEELSCYDKYWNKFPALKSKLFSKEGDYYKFSNSDLKNTILNDADVKAFLEEHHDRSEQFKQYLISRLIHSSTDVKTKDGLISSIFSSFNNIDLIDKYDIYQIFADCWVEIESDLVRLRSEGKDVCRKMEEDIVLKKDSTTHKIEEVVVGMKGSIFPLDFIKTSFFKQDFDMVKHYESRLSDAKSVYTDLYESLDEDIQKKIANEKDKSKIDSKKLKVEIKNNIIDKEIIEQLKTILSAMEKEKADKKAIKEIIQQLDKKAQEKLANLTDIEIDELLEKKWIEPLFLGMKEISDSVISNFSNELKSLKDKYDNPMEILAEQENSINSELNVLLNDLTGSITDVKAVQMLMKEL
jgi:type I restriction enzyme M protein